MSEHKATILLTAKSVERILREGGTSSWRLDRNNARQREFAVCTRNANADWNEGIEEHHAAFLIGKVKDVVICPSRADRFLIQFSEYALVNISEVWKGDRNPIKYGTLEEFGIDPSTLEWKPMPAPDTTLVPQELIANGHVANMPPVPMTIAEAKKRLR